MSKFKSMSQTQLATAVGKTRQAIYNWTNEGMPRNGDGSYSLPDVVAWLVQRERDNTIADQAMC